MIACRFQTVSKRLFGRGRGRGSICCSGPPSSRHPLWRQTTIQHLPTGKPTFGLPAFVSAASLLLIGSLAGAQDVSSRGGKERYASATIDASGNLAIKTVGGETRVVPKGDDIDRFETVKISKDGMAVGAEALSLDCCQSYPILTKIIVYVGGRVHQLDASGLSIRAWRFANNGKQLALAAQQHQLFCMFYYVLYDVETGREVGTSSEELECQYIERPQKVRQPTWVRDLGADREAWK